MAQKDYCPRQRGCNLSLCVRVSVSLRKERHWFVNGITLTNHLTEHGLQHASLQPGAWMAGAVKEFIWKPHPGNMSRQEIFSGFIQSFGTIDEGIARFKAGMHFFRNHAFEKYSGECER